MEDVQIDEQTLKRLANAARDYASILSITGQTEQAKQITHDVVVAHMAILNLDE